MPARPQPAQAQIRAFYRQLFRAWGRQHWWPAQSRFEVIVGAFLTQNTAWTNVERALRQLRRARALNPRAIRSMPLEQLEPLIRSAGYFRQKAHRLKTFVTFLDQRYSGSLPRMFATPTLQLRQELLALHGVGPETADSILLYAGSHAVFPVDAYTRRVLERHGLAGARTTYEQIRTLFESALRKIEGPVAEAGGVPAHRPSRASRLKRTPSAQVYNEMHGLIVSLGKRYCLKSRAMCEQCPLDRFPHLAPPPAGKIAGARPRI